MGNIKGHYTTERPVAERIEALGMMQKVADSSSLWVSQRRVNCLCQRSSTWVPFTNHRKMKVSKGERDGERERERERERETGTAFDMLCLRQTGPRLQ